MVGSDGSTWSIFKKSPIQWSASYYDDLKFKPISNLLIKDSLKITCSCCSLWRTRKADNSPFHILYFTFALKWIRAKNYKIARDWHFILLGPFAALLGFYSIAWLKATLGDFGWVRRSKSFVSHSYYPDDQDCSINWNQTRWTIYCKIPIISPGLIFVQKAFLLGLFSGSLFSEGLIIGGNFAF